MNARLNDPARALTPAGSPSCGWLWRPAPSGPYLQGWASRGGHCSSPQPPGCDRAPPAGAHAGLGRLTVRCRSALPAHLLTARRYATRRVVVGPTVPLTPWRRRIVAPRSRDGDGAATRLRVSDDGKRGRLRAGAVAGGGEASSSNARANAS